MYPGAPGCPLQPSSTPLCISPAPNQFPLVNFLSLALIAQDTSSRVSTVKRPKVRCTPPYEWPDCQLLFLSRNSKDLFFFLGWLFFRISAFPIFPHLCIESLDLVTPTLTLSFWPPFDLQFAILPVFVSPNDPPRSKNMSVSQASALASTCLGKAFSL